MRRIWERFSLMLVVIGLVLCGLSVFAVAEPLKDVQQGTVADCSGGVTWHFVHNQTDALEGLITVGDQVVANGAPFTANVLHYYVNTSGSVLPDDVHDNVDGGKLVLSDYTCTQVTTTTTASTTTTTEATTTTTEPETTTTTRPEETTTTSHPYRETTTTTQPTTTTVSYDEIVPPGPPAPPAELPFTGGPSLWLVALGLALFSAGAFMVTLTRRPQ